VRPVGAITGVRNKDEGEGGFASCVLRSARMPTPVSVTTAGCQGMKNDPRGFSKKKDNPTRIVTIGLFARATGRRRLVDLGDTFPVCHLLFTQLASAGAEFPIVRA